MRGGLSLTVADRPVSSPYTPEYQALVDVLRAAREECGMSHQELADKLGESRMYVYKIETLRRRVDPAEVRLIALALGREPHQVFDAWLKRLDR